MNISAKLKVSASKSATSPSCKPLCVSIPNDTLKTNTKAADYMKTFFLTLTFALTTMLTSAQSTSDIRIQNISTDSEVTYRLFSTRNMYTFIKLDTRNGKMWQVQWSTKGSDYRFETTLSDISRVDKEEEKNGRFFSLSNN